MPQRNEPIAVIGSACQFPGQSTTPSKLWELLREPRDLLQTIPSDRFNAESWYHADSAHHGTSNVTKSYFLAEDPTAFDSQFFNIPPKECEAIDPQQRLLMETVYDSLCAAGLSMKSLRGTSTACYVGQMCDDWSGIMMRDWDSLPQYTATGISRSIMSNRVSYFFDWHGPSMTIDTACSSSLVAVHEAVQVLRSGDSKVAVACGANLILSPGMYIAESKLKMLSPDGRSRMWDEGANGYARGEGIAAVVLKTLSQALADGDHIECIVRETGFNQDGRTTGITMPSNVAQAALIRDTYRKAGLDPYSPNDRPQFFHAHGTGTPAGDPQESEAISRAFFKDGERTDNKLYVGSIKTVIGHTEGTAGLASLIGTSLALQHKTIPPNMHFNKLAEKVAPFYTNLEVPTTAKEWPAAPSGQPLRASVNSFGFGGANAHAILERYEPETHGQAATDASLPLFTPLTFSAGSEKSLQAMLASFSDYLKTNESTTNIRDIAWTLQNRRSELAFKTAVSGQTSSELVRSIDAALDSKENLGVRSSSSSTTKPSILGVFTGQGAQWPTMGAALLRASPYARDAIAALDASLQDLPEADRPAWSIRAELEAPKESSRLAEAALSQPLCTAVQVVLVDLIRAAGVEFKAVVGHSSGEIAAAYAAGLVSARDAIRIAYYRGVYAKLAGSSSGAKGAMMAVGTSLEDAREFCELEEFEGRLTVAASNAASSVTLSGDEDAIDQAEEIFKDESKFARKLRVDTAYHSFHMVPCSKPYLEALDACKVQVGEATATTWFSSVVPGTKMSKETLGSQYWVDNMKNTVLFSQAVSAAVNEAGPFDLAIEVGPHPALKGPCLNNIEDASGSPDTPYTGLLSRGSDDVNAFSAALGFIWERFGAEAVDFDAYDKLVSGSSEPKSLAVDLPRYPWDHDRTYWFESRVSAGYKYRDARPHPILGVKSIEGTTGPQIQWRNIITQREVSWTPGHKLQGQTVFPAAGYVSMAIEAIMTLAGENSVQLVELTDFVIGRAISFFDESAAQEVMFTLNITANTDEAVSATFEVTSCPQGERQMSQNAKGAISITLGVPSHDTLAAVPVQQFNMVDVEVDRFYKALSDMGYHYSPPFKAMSSIRRRVDTAVGEMTDIRGEHWEDNLLLHPGLLDTSFQAIFAAFSSPGDERLWSIHVPTIIKRMTFNPAVASFPPGEETIWPWQAAITSGPHQTLRADIEVFAENGEDVLFEVEGISMVPFSNATAENDCHLFSNFVYDIDGPSGELAGPNHPTDFDVKLATDSERFSFYWMRTLLETITPEEEEQTLIHYKRMLKWCRFVLDQVKSGEHPHVKQEALNDTLDFVEELVKPYGQRADIDLIRAVGEDLPMKIRTNGNIVETMVRDGMLDAFYEEGLGLHIANNWEANMAVQLTHRYPRMNVLEIGGGTGGSTRIILPRLGQNFSTYTFTDVSAGFFEAAEERFKDYADRMVFKTLDMEKDITEQGFQEGHYDMILASNVLHVGADLDATMSNVRRLLKPGGWLINMETVTFFPCLRNGFAMAGLSGWWIGADTGRPWGPTIDIAEWDKVYKRTGFSGVDTFAPNFDSLHPFSVMAAQAVDERVSFLRKPLEVEPADAKKEELVVIGGRTEEVSEIVDRVVELLTPRFSSVTRVDSVDAFVDGSAAVPTCVLNLSELDTPVMQELMDDQPDKFDALKEIFSSARDILWVTKGSRAESPYSRMVVGMARAIRKEIPSVNFQNLDVDVLDEGSAELFAATMLRHQTLHRWEKELLPGALRWSREPEMHLENGKIYLPRLKSAKDLNDRYNSTKRQIAHGVSVKESRIELVGTKDSYELREPSPLKPAPATEGKVVIKVTKSLLQSVKVPTAGYYFLCYGTTESGETVVAFSDSSESVIAVPKNWTVPHSAKVDPAKALLSIAANILADLVTTVAPAQGTLLAHDPDPIVAAALSRQAAAKRIRVFFTTTQANKKRPNWIYIHPNSPRRLLKKSLPKGVSLFINLSGRDDSKLIDEISEYLPAGCTLSDSSPFFGNTVEMRPAANPDLVGRYLSTGWANAKASSFAIPGSTTEIPLKDVPGHRGKAEQLSVVDWAADAMVPANVQPIDTGANLFKPDRTYFMVGLSGEVGQSITQWMIRHGARHVVLTSRNPQVDPEWIETLEDEYAAVVKTMSLDVTDRESLHACYDKINRTMPPIAGVAHGAMVLIDSLFQNMEYEDLMTVLRPKILGAIYLDELFAEDTLDFFILFSSITGTVGNTGQSNYIGANSFMEALGLQRRARGLAASILGISSLVGIGYVERAENFDAEYFAKSGYRNISEQDLHMLFAEAVVRGRPECKESHEIITGIVPTYADQDSKAGYLQDIKFSHLALERSQARNDGGAAAAVPVRIQLQTAVTKDEVLEIMQDGFVARVKKVLRIPAEDDFSLTASLVEQGVDSLVAVEVRSWFLKEVDLDMPVLKVLGGASISDLLADALDRLSPELVPNLGADPSTVSRPSPAAVAPAPKAVAPAPPPAPSVSRPASNAPPGLNKQLPPPSSTTELKAERERRAEAARKREAEEEKRAKDAARKAEEVRKANRARRETREAQKTDASRDALIKSEITEPMSFGQSRFWLLDQMLKDRTTFNMAISVRLEGAIRVEDMRMAVRAVVLRHEALRTRYFSTGEHGDTPMQGIAASSSSVPFIHKHIKSEAEAQADLDAVRAHVWDMATWLGITVHLLSMPSSRVHFLIIGCHHITLDGVSLNILYADLEKAYKGGSPKSLPPLPASAQYRAFARQQHADYAAGKMDADLAFYRALIPEPAAVKPLPLFPFARVRERVPLESYGEVTATARVDAGLTARIRAAARAAGATTFHFYLATLHALIYKLLPDLDDDVFIGIADANRTDAKFAGTLGFFLNLLPLRFSRGKAAGEEQEKKTFSECVKQARTKAYAALAHSRLPFDVLLDHGLPGLPRSAAHAPLFQVFVDYRTGVQERQRYMGVKASGESWYTARTGYDVALDIIENAAGDARVEFKLQDAFYGVEGAEVLVDLYVNVLRQFAEEPGRGWGDVEVWPRGRVEQAVTVGRVPSPEYEWPATVGHRIDEMIKKHASDLAIKDGRGNVLTYAQMDERANSIAAALVENGAADGGRVGVFQNPTADWICSVVAIFRAGAVYIPLDLRNPLTRLASIVKAAKPAAILAHSETWEKVEALGGADSRAINVSTLPASHEPVANRAKADGPAVILFTSGSTGTPKGMHMSHSNLVKHMEAWTVQKTFPENATKLVLQQSAYTFDKSLEQILTPITMGGALYVVPAEQRGDPVSITQIIVSEGVTYTDATPSEYLMWFTYAGQTLRQASTWKFAVTAGEAVTESLLDEFRKLDLPVTLVNNYGPAEATLDATLEELPYRTMKPGDQISAGIPLPGYTVYIVDEELKPVPIGWPGEVVLAGVGIVDGYLNDPSLTAKKFLPDVFANDGGRMYRTGDRGRLSAKGQLLYEGRIEGDTQIKLRGVRMELEDIEASIMSTANGVLSRAVVSLRGEAGAEFLVAHVVFAPGFARDQTAFIHRFPATLPLPQYMVPAVFAVVDALPLTPHLKVDRKAIKSLPLPEQTAQPTTAAADDNNTLAALTPTERRLAAIWQEIIPGAPGTLSPDTEFFHVGGNSLLLVKLQALVRQAFAGASLRLIDLMDAGSLSGMARAIDDVAPVSAPQAAIDWDAETAVPADLATRLALPAGSEKASKPKRGGDAANDLTVVLTGATGVLGRNLLQRLVADPRVKKMYAVAVRPALSSSSPSSPRIPPHPKLTTLPGDLTLPLLGLSPAAAATIAAQADVFVHAAANRSFWDGYGSLRAANVGSVREVVALAAPRGVRVHFVSSGEVTKYSGGVPPADGSDGYVASKWAAERFLEKVVAEGVVPGLEVVVHRPQGAETEARPAPAEVLAELVGLAKQVGRRPVLEGVAGSLGVLPVREILGGVARAVFGEEEEEEEGEEGGKIKVVDHVATMNVDIGAFAESVAGDEELMRLEGMDALTWTGEVKKAGWSMFMVSQEIVMMKEGDAIVSKR
ncbi:PKS-NRPS hybrid synthetase psoA [Lasiodiplodia theobromae]|uniref:PKS-NRPS hybrid synthetase psoA n=1 Tax=Lasiodiplodia theobromae TaxID=45133 RepID=A0A5N5D0F3_9PEZI|nr:PKS-NRPS hybrid synthetase psoA [Lasiodiplodia theobromae]